MLTVIRNDAGQLLVACDWWLVDEQGKRDNAGRYVWVEQLETAGKVPLIYLRELMHEIAVRAPEAVGAYWERKTTDKRLHGYRRDQLLKEVRVA